ncbi:MAG: MltA domain-containing protein [Thermodesulfobacteriota bacterium]
MARALVVARVLAALVSCMVPGALVAGAATTERAGAFSDHGDRDALRLAVVEALGELEQRAAAPDASAGTGSAVRGLRALRDALSRPERDLAAALAERFTASPARPIFVTGYHEPTLAARRTREGRFRHPLYAAPPAGGPLPSRAEIEDGALAGRGLELFWTDDPVELFFLHVQGSGRLVLEDGDTVRIGYAGNNGKTYRSIGAELVERGVFRPTQATAPAIKRWLREHPDEAPALLRKNPRYVFFAVREATAEEGPRGALGVPLVAWRSVAVDPAVVPLGSIGHLSVELPGGERFASLVVAMDAGTAIKGKGRIDLFCGSGAKAERVAGELRHRGGIAWLEPRP